MKVFDQSFSADNFRRIFDYENRKGNYLEEYFFPNVVKITKEIRDTRIAIKDIKNRKSSLKAAIYEKEISTLYEELTKLKEDKDKLLEEELSKISDSIANESFPLTLEEIDTSKGKKAYKLKKNAESYFSLKQVQNNLRRLYKVKQSNRHEIICQLREALSDRLPKHVIKTDIEGFYENITRGKLVDKLNNDSLLNIASRKIILRTLYEYGKVSNAPRGLPRGIGISAYLSELYLRKFDEEMLKSPNLLYYARYVDDIILVYAIDPNITPRRRLAFVKKSLRDNYKLSLNRSKTFIIETDGTKQKEIEYLGYKFLFGAGNINLSLTISSIEKYKTRIKKSLEDYAKTFKAKNKKAKALLIKRIRFLTGNTYLVNNKGNVAIGIYFSHHLINNFSCLRALDNTLNQAVKNIGDTKLQNTLQKLSFTDGFKEKRFFKFSIKDFEKIMKAW